MKIHHRWSTAAALAIACAFGAGLAHGGQSQNQMPDRHLNSLPVILVADKAGDARDARYRNWLLRRSRTGDSRAEQVLTYLNARARNAPPNYVGEGLNDVMTEAYRADTNRDYASFLERRAALSNTAAQVRTYLATNKLPPDVSARKMRHNVRHLRRSFEKARHRERDFIAWARSRAGRGDELAISVIAAEDGANTTLSETEQTDLRRALLADYTALRNQTARAFADARQDLAALLRPIAADARNRGLAAAIIGQRPFAITDDQLAGIDAALDRIAAVQTAANDEFGDLAGNNLLATTAVYADEPGQLARNQNQIDRYCGQTCAAMLADDENVDQFLMTNPRRSAFRTGTTAEAMTSMLAARGYDARQVDFEQPDAAAGDDGPLSDAQIQMRRNLIADVLISSRNPVFVLIENRDEYSELALRIERNTPPGLREQLGEARWSRLTAAYEEGRYNHWILLDDIRQFDNQTVGAIRDPNADSYDAPLSAIARASNYSLVYVIGDRQEVVPEEPIELDPPEGSE